MSYRLFTTYYDEKNAARRAELDLSLTLNLAAFDHVCVLSENVDRPRDFPGAWFAGEHRQTYADLLALAAGTRGDTSGVTDAHALNVIANCDIILPRCELAKMDAHLQPGDAYCLTRWDLTAAGGIRLFDAVYSQDVWAFRGPPREKIGGTFPLGHPGCDNRFAHELDAAGYRVLNPSKDIRTYHLHLSGHRTSNKPENRVPLPYLFVKPAALGDEPSYCRPKKASKRPSQFQQ